jgi:3-methyladenine DNA glycosylase AlkD
MPSWLNRARKFAIRFGHQRTTNSRTQLEALELSPRTDVNRVASQILAECAKVPHPSTAGERKIRRKYSRLLHDWPLTSILELARVLCRKDDNRWLAYEIVASHPGFSSLGERDIERLGDGVNSWWTVDAFSRSLAGPAWLHQQISDATVRRWAASTDHWWRRVALVSTVALNMRSHGGRGDSRRTLDICARLAADRTDMVAKGMSWALRELVVHDRAGVRRFLSKNRERLHSRVVREVTNKLDTGLKNPTKSP